MFSDTGLTTALAYDELISSGFALRVCQEHFGDDATEEGCKEMFGEQLAVDGDKGTSWRPQDGTGPTSASDPFTVHAISPGEAWIGMRFNTRTVVKGAEALGLGVGSGSNSENGGEGPIYSWNGGITLQSSEDGVTWTTVATSWDSDSVTAEEATSPAYILPEEAGIACPFGYDHVTTDAECRAGGVEVGATPPNESYDNRGNDACGVCLADGNSCCNEDWVTLNGWASGNGCYRPVCAVAPPM